MGRPRKNPLPDPTLPKRPRGHPKGQAHLKGGARLDSGLTISQEAYCRARALGMDVDEALLAIGAPVAKRCAQKWEREDPRIRSRINELSDAATKNAILKTGLDREWVISRLMSVVERSMQAEPVLDREGSPTGEYKFDAPSANQALRMLGDTMGLFKPAEKQAGDEYANLSDDDLRRIAHELAQQTGLLALPGADVIDV